MEKSKALVIGALGQDGSYMCDILLEKGYEVFGLVKINSHESRFNPNVTYIKDNIDNIKNILSEIKPTHVYNFMGVTDVFEPWSNGVVVYEKNFLVPIKIIEAIKEVDINIKFLQASSSLVFGETETTPQNEETTRNPIYHYGIAKNFTDEIVKLYRNRDNMKLNSVILYPHESERRGDNFFSKKVINTAISIMLGDKDKLEVGDVNGFRDIGYAKDYMYGCYLIMDNDVCSDYVIGTGESVKTIDFINIVFSKLGLNLGEKLSINDSFKRGVDLSKLVADNTKIKKLGWEPKTKLDEIIDIMIENKLKNMKKKEIVIAAYDKELTWMEGFNPDIKQTIYRKGEKTDNPNEIFIEKNAGRCVHSFFNHIYTNYDNLSDHTFFAQDFPFDHWEDLIYVVNSDVETFKNRAALNIGGYYGYHFNTITIPSEKGGIMHTMYPSQHHGDGKIISCYSNGMPHDHNSNINVDLYWDMLFDEPKPSIYEFIPGGHFGITKEHAHIRSCEFYKKICELLIDNETAPWMIERLECYIFNSKYKTKF